MTSYKPPTPEALALLKALDRQSVTLTDHELAEDDDGAPAGVTTTQHAPALFVVPLGSFGFPSRAEVYGTPDDAA